MFFNNFVPQNIQYKYQQIKRGQSGLEQHQAGLNYGPENKRKTR